LQFGYIVVVRGEMGRREYGVMVKSSLTISSKNLKEMQAATILQSGLCFILFCLPIAGALHMVLLTIHFPSVIRGWLVRRKASNFNKPKKSRENARTRRRSRVKMPEEKVLFGASFLNFWKTN